MLSLFCFANLRKMVAIRKQVLCGPRYIELYKIKRALDFFEKNWKEQESGYNGEHQAQQRSCAELRGK